MSNLKYTKLKKGFILAKIQSTSKIKNKFC